MSIKRIDSHRSLERKQWAQLDRYRKDMKLVGRGEGYVKEIYFGRGFSSPPSFSYSALFEEEEVPIKPWFLVPPRGAEKTGLDQYGMGNDTFGPNGMIQDPGFELQGKYRNLSASSGWDEIPDTYERAKAIGDYEWGRYDEIADPNGDAAYEAAMFPLAHHFAFTQPAYTNDWAPRYEIGRDPWNPYAMIDDFYDHHRWLQTGETRNKWTVTTADRHDLGVGLVGGVCATAVIGPDGYTNWLLPFDYSWPHYTYNVHPENAWRTWRSVTEALGSNVSAAYGGGAWMQAYPPPYIEGFEGFAHVKCVNAVELQVNATFHFDAYWYDGPRGTPVFPDSEFDWFDPDDPGDAYAYDQYSYKELASVDFTQLVRGGDWSRVEVTLPYDGWRSWPSTRNCEWAKDEPGDDMWWNFRYRVKGTPGDTVYLDNIYLTRKMRNAEIPMLTIGVDEWIRDDAGVYIGARLWVTMGDPKREWDCDGV